MYNLRILKGINSVYDNYRLYYYNRDAWFKSFGGIEEMEKLVELGDAIEIPPQELVLMDVPEFK